MSDNGSGVGRGQFPNFNNKPQGVPVYLLNPNTLKRKLPSQLPPGYLQQQQVIQQQQPEIFYGSPDKQIKFEPRRTGVPIAVQAMFNPNQGQQGQNIQQPQQMIFQGQAQGLQQNAPQQNAQGQPGQQPQQRRVAVPLTEEDRQKYINNVKSIIDRYGAESPQAKQAQRNLQAMMQYMQQQNRAVQQGHLAQGSDSQAAAQGRPGMGHSVSSPAQFQPPPNADPQRLHQWRLNLTGRYSQAHQKMKLLREQLQIQSQQMGNLTQAGQTPESPSVLQIKATMNELAKQFKTIESWCQAAKSSGHILQNPIQQQNRLQASAGAVNGGPSGGQQQGGAGAVQMQQQSSSMGVEQQNVGGQQQVQPQQAPASPLQQASQQPQAHQMPQQVPQQVQGLQQHPPTQQRPTAPQQANQGSNTSQHASPALANRQQQPLVRPSTSPTAQASMPQVHQSPAMSPQLSQQGIQGQHSMQQQMARQTPVPAQQVPGGSQAVRQSPAPGTPATPNTQHQQQVRDASVPSRPGSAAPVVPSAPGQVPVMPLQPQQGLQQQVPARMGGASAQSPPPQQQIPQMPERNIANRMPIPKTLNIEPKGPVPIQTRPTFSGGANTAGTHVMGTPALVKNPPFEFDEGGMGLLSKRKLEELVKQIDPDEKLDPEVEESVLELVDEFIDTVVTYACKMAKLRGSDTLDIKDMQIILERNWNIRVPGYAADEIRTVRKFAPAQGYLQKIGALAAGKALNQTNLKGGD